MRVALITSMFKPEMGATANRMYPIVRRLANEGHDVFVITGMPNYPSGKVAPGYQGKLLMREPVEGATVLRTAYYTVPRNKAKIPQLLSYLSFIPSALVGGLRAGKLDVVFATSPPLFLFVPAVWLKKIRRCKLVLDLRDLWPDEVVACGASSEKSLAVRLLAKIERWSYRNADTILCTTQAFIDTIVERGVPREKTVLAPNGADVDLFRPLPQYNTVAEQYPLGKKFVVMYSGLLGIKHGIEVILDAARALANEPDIVFFIRGNGPRREALMELVQSSGLTNVVFGDERPIEDVPPLIARADVCVTSLLPDPYLDKIISVKIFEYLACERPVVAALGGEGARVITDCGGGIVVPAGDATAMADAILHLYRNPDLRMEMGMRGRRYVERNYSRGTTAERISQTMARLCGAESAAVS